MSRSRMMTVVGLLGALVLPVLAGVYGFRAMGVEIMRNDLALVGIVLASYTCGAAYLLSHYPLLILRVRIGLFISLMSIAGIFAAVLMAPAGERTSLFALAVFAVISSVPLLIFGLHNILWPIGRSSASKAGASAA